MYNTHVHYLHEDESLAVNELALKEMGGVAREGEFSSFWICGDLTIKEKQIREEASKGVTPL